MFNLNMNRGRSSRHHSYGDKKYHLFISKKIRSYGPDKNEGL